MENNNIVIGIEGLVGAGKTSICRQMLKEISNCVLLNGGNLYRSIVYALLKENKLEDLQQNIKNVDIRDVMENLGIEIKIEDSETKFFYNGEELKEEDLQSPKSSMAVSKIGGIADNTKLFEFASNLIDNLKKDHNVIVSGRSIMRIYPKIDYHFFITATLEERVKRKANQYQNKIDLKELENQIKVRDELQEKAGFYEISRKTIQVDVTDCKSIEESTKKVLEYLEQSN